ncbi:MAG: 3-methyl-2-oxobutanoate dehydrogenase subunit VorB [bacterium]
MKKLMKGNIALCEGAIAAGCDAYFGYPITPQNEIPAHMSRRMTELNRVFLQAESELAAINMVFGASVAGKRSMTSSSSPGISLKQEGISYLAGAELPSVIVNIVRGGPGLGNISGSQSDYFQATRGGGHGDYRTIVLAPDSIQEMYELCFLAFYLADLYRIPVLILSDGIIGQMMEPLDLARAEDFARSINAQTLPNKDWALTGCVNRKPRFIRSLIMNEGGLEEFNYKLGQKHAKISEHEVRYETHQTDNQQIMVVAFGIAARVAQSAVNILRKKGKKVGFLRPISLWPFPSAQLAASAKSAKKILVVEYNMGQMIEDVRLAVNGRVEVDFFGKPGGGVITDEEIIDRVLKIYEN